MKISFASKSVQGKREENQDCTWGKVYRKPSGCIYAVGALADGMGGLREGKRAAEMAIDVAKDALKNPPGKDTELVPWTEGLFRTAHKRIVAEGKELGITRGIGTTLVLVAVGFENVLVAHVGDSRCYRVRAGGAEQVTRDHTMLQEVMDVGLGKKEEIKPTSEYRGLAATLVRGLGVGENAQPDTRMFPRAEGEIFFMCSDGLSGSAVEPLVDCERLYEELTRNKRLAPALANLVKTAYELGSSDNITAAAVELGTFTRAE
ncbi:MAG: serine/threonine-protein phosphatase [Candidatus Eisenbacteria sp.]|nr:serine/threonine-protein phosphatase [Candidatus Eisenbacteria bacterium]